jgi:hypothetical protein
LKRSTLPVEVLWCSNNRQGRSNGWSFPPAVRRQLEADFAGKRILHPFGGRSTFGIRVDIDPIVRPDVIGDAWLLPFKRDAFDVVVLDPPYVRFNAHEKVSLLRAAAWVASETVVWFHTMWISAAAGLRTDRGFLVRVGDQCHVRALQYFRVGEKKEPKFFTRGPAIRYNRWLAQPQALPFAGGDFPAVRREALRNNSGESVTITRIPGPWKNDTGWRLVK